MQKEEEEGLDPAAQAAAEEWCKRFGREGHEGSYAQHQDGEEGGDESQAPEETSRTSP